MHLGEAKGAEARDRQGSRPVTGTRPLQKLSMDTARFPGPQVPSSVVMCRQLPSVGRWLYPVTPRPQSRPPLSASGRPGTDAAAPSPAPGHLAQEAQNPAGRQPHQPFRLWEQNRCTSGPQKGDFRKGPVPGGHC